MVKPTSRALSPQRPTDTPDLFSIASSPKSGVGGCSPTFPPIAVRIEQARRMIGISRTKLYELIGTGEVETIKLGRATLLLVESLRALVERRRLAPNAGSAAPGL